ncbi:MAG: hypothetical protein ABFD61_08990 [Chloroherpetonaceae bacterium]
MSNVIQEKLNGIIFDFESGSREIASKVFSFVHEFLNTASNNDWKAELSEYLQAISSKKKSMAIIKNQTSILQEMIADAKTMMELNIKLQNFEYEFKSVLSKIIENARIEIFNEKKSYRIITCSYSSNIREILLYFSKNISIQLFVVKSIFKNKDVSAKYKTDFASSPIAIRHIEQSEIAFNINYIDLGMIGADAVIDNNYVINGTPSLLLAENLLGGNHPFYSIAEKLKFTDDIEIEEGFDKIPIKYITKIITE